MLLLFAVTSTITAKNGRDFSGFYNLVNVTDKGAEVQATFVVRLFNYSGLDLKQAAVSVRESPPGLRTLASFRPVSTWADGTDIVMEQQISISRQEFEQWSQHCQPAVFVIYKDDNGHEFQKTAQVSPHPIAAPQNEAQ
ncbi:MAG TPA: hypothetical protein VKR61_25765 [Bryobacteraceae bacterium]|nr:hypothetical protein [Bryobacteraceae bacterium]